MSPDLGYDGTAGSAALRPIVSGQRQLSAMTVGIPCGGRGIPRQDASLAVRSSPNSCNCAKAWRYRPDMPAPALAYEQQETALRIIDVRAVISAAARS